MEKIKRIRDVNTQLKGKQATELARLEEEKTKLEDQFAIEKAQLEKLISEKILDKSNRFDMFDQIKHLKIPGGNLLRRPIYSSAIIYYRAIDFFNRL